ncbi:MAG: rhomboid family intramembrane serine protease [Bryobacteraceae bacterium]
MIPLRALLTRYSTPIVTLVIILANTAIFLYEWVQPYYSRNMFIEHYGLVPDRLHLSMLVTSMFLHGGWLHLIGNMWFLWVFGSHIEDAVGAVKYAILYLLCGIVAGIVQVYAMAGSPVPTIGASGAIAGIMGAFLLLYPRVRITTLIFLFVFIMTIEVPAALMLIYWFAIQLLSGFASYRSFSIAGGVAWFAHVGGFIAGLLLVRLFYHHTRQHYYKRYNP